MKKYRVEAVIYGYVEVLAETEDDAAELARNELGYCGLNDWVIEDVIEIED